MDTQTISTSKAQQELTVKEAAPVQKTAGAEAVTPKKVSPASTAVRPKCDQYIPEQPKESYGHYKPVVDDNGVIQIKFDAPAEDAAAQKSQTEQAVRRNRQSRKPEKGRRSSSFRARPAPECWKPEKNGWSSRSNPVGTLRK